MKLQNKITHDVLEVLPPDPIGASVIKLNGIVVEHVFYSDRNGVTLGNGAHFNSGEDFAAYLVNVLRELE